MADIPGMVARVLRAIYEAERQPMSDDDWAGVMAWHTSSEVVRKGGEWSHLRMASAAIEAMRESTEEMVDHVAKSLFAAQNGGYKPPGAIKWDGLTERDLAKWRYSARQAIAAAVAAALGKHQ